MTDAEFLAEVKRRLQFAPGVVQPEAMWNLLTTIREVDADAFNAFVSRGQPRGCVKGARGRYAATRKLKLHALFFADWLMDCREAKSLRPFRRKYSVPVKNEAELDAAISEA